MRVQAVGVGILTLSSACAHTSRLESATWRDLVAPNNGVTLRAPADYHPRNSFGCWTRRYERWGRAGWRDLCVDAVDSTSRHYSFTSPENGKCIADCITIDELRVDTVVIEGRRAIIERARVSGGISSMDKERELLVRIQASNGTVLELHGETGDEHGYDELIAVAATMRELPASREPTKNDPLR
jgi:hypothetical protein